jgi:hypothetical protein
MTDDPTPPPYLMLMRLFGADRRAKSMDMYVAACETAAHPDLRVVWEPHDAIQPRTVTACRGSRVVLFGATWDPASVAVLAGEAASVTVMVTTRAVDHEYRDLPVKTCRLQVEEECDLSWALFGGLYRPALRTMHVMPYPADPDAAAALRARDMNVRRGLEVGAGGPDVTDWLREQIRAGVPAEDVAEKAVAAAVAVAAGEAMRSRSVAARGRVVRFGPFRAWLVAGPWSPVTSVARAAATAANARGLDLAITIRHSLATGNTYFTFMRTAHITEATFGLLKGRPVHAAGPCCFLTMTCPGWPVPEGGLLPWLEWDVSAIERVVDPGTGLESCRCRPNLDAFEP